MAAFAKLAASTTRRRRSRLRAVDLSEGETRLCNSRVGLSFTPGFNRVTGQGLALAEPFQRFPILAIRKTVETVRKTDGDTRATRLKPGENESGSFLSSAHLSYLVF